MSLEKTLEALEKAKQGIREVNKANKDPNWFTGGWAGATRHRHHWEREKNAAIETALTELQNYMDRLESEEFLNELHVKVYPEFKESIAYFADCQADDLKDGRPTAFFNIVMQAAIKVIKQGI